MKKYKDIAGDGGSNIVGQVEVQQAKSRATSPPCARSWPLSPARAARKVVRHRGPRLRVRSGAPGRCHRRRPQRPHDGEDARRPRPASQVRRGGRRAAPGFARSESNVHGSPVVLGRDAAHVGGDDTGRGAHWRGTMEANALREFLVTRDIGNVRSPPKPSSRRRRSRIGRPSSSRPCGGTVPELWTSDRSTVRGPGSRRRDRGRVEAPVSRSDRDESQSPR